VSADLRAAAHRVVAAHDRVSTQPEGFWTADDDDAVDSLRAALAKSDSRSYASQETLSETVLCAECERPWKRGHECDDRPVCEDEYDALARQLHESIAEGQPVALTAKALRILAAKP
jgi:hypothetical protein